MSDEAIGPKVVILCADGAPRPTGLDSIESEVDFVFVDAAGLQEALSGAEVLLLWDFSSSALSLAWSAADALRWVHIAAAGVDKLLFPALVDSRVVVTNAHGTFDRPMAEFVLASILAHAKRLHEIHDRQLTRTWLHQETDSIVGKTVIVVGTGGIGRTTAVLLRAVGMQVRGAGRVARSDDPDFGEIIASRDLAEHVGWADHVVLAAPLTDQTRGLVGVDVLAAMKGSAHLINVGRGQLVDETALVRALENGQIAAASLDVFESEPLPPDHRLWQLPNVVVSPHLSGDAVGWRETLSGQFIDNLRRYLNADPLINEVDKTLGYVPSGAASS